MGIIAFHDYLYVPDVLASATFAFLAAPICPGSSSLTNMHRLLSMRIALPTSYCQHTTCSAAQVG